MNYPDGVACKHPGCLSHISHPCEGCGRVGGRTPDGYDPEVWVSPEGKKYSLGIDVGEGDFGVTRAWPELEGLLYDGEGEPSAPTYGGVVRGSMPLPESWKDVSGLTLESLQKYMDALPKFPKLPAYYRAHPSTIINMGRYIDPPVDGRDVERLHFSGIKIVPDNDVPPGEFWPPEDEEKPE